MGISFEKYIVSFYNSYKCPRCGKSFPIYIAPSKMIFRGLKPPYLECSNCGQICQSKFDIRNALWAWPLAIGLYIAFFVVADHSLFHKAPLFALFIVVIFVFLVCVFMRRGFKLASIEDDKEAQHSFYRWLLPTLGVGIFATIYGLITHDWLNIAVGVIIGYIVWVFYYILVRKKRGSVK